MAFSVRTRYGAHVSHGDGADVKAVVEKLLRELEFEQFDEPDDEHDSVSVVFGDWAVSVRVSGLLTLSDLSWVTGVPGAAPPPELHMRARRRVDVVRLLCQLARGRIEKVRAAAWVPVEQLPPRERDFFRRGG
jgi:hypothetical protein